MNTLEKLDKGKVLEIAIVLGFGKTLMRVKNMFRDINI